MNYFLLKPSDVLAENERLRALEFATRDENERLRAEIARLDDRWDRIAQGKGGGMTDLNKVTEAFAVYRGLGKTLIDEMVEEIKQSRALNAELVAALERLNDRAESVIYTDVVGNRFCKVFADDLEKARAALAKAKE